MEENEEDFEKFLENMIKDSDKDLLRFLLSNPLYRAMVVSNKNELYGKENIPKNREPKDNPEIINNVIDNYLKRNGFKAVRSNSIFCSGDMSFIKRFLGRKGDVYVIFPTKKFYFTWNKQIKDFYIWVLVTKENFDMFTFDFYSLSSLPKENVYSFYRELIKILNKRESKINDDVLGFFINEAEKNLKQKEYDILAQIFTRFFNKHYYSIISSLFYSILKAIYYYFKEEDQMKILKINEKSNYAKGFDNKNFEEAIKSGHEIMLTNDYFYYIKYDFFTKNKDLIERKIQELL